MPSKTTQSRANGTDNTNTHTTLAAALVAAQADLPAVEKDGENPHFRSRFTTLGNLLAKSLPVLNRHGLSLLQQPTHMADGAPALKTTLLHTSGEQIEEVTPLIVGKNDPQGYGSALTYFRRYTASALLGISDQTDDDGNQAQPRPAAARPANGQNTPPPVPQPAPQPDPEAAVQKLVESDGELIELRSRANKGMASLGAGPEQRLRELQGAADVRSLEALIGRVQAAMDNGGDA